jgi:hypothetical protein
MKPLFKAKALYLQAFGGRKTRYKNCSKKLKQAYFKA